MTTQSDGANLRADSLPNPISTSAGTTTKDHLSSLKKRAIISSPVKCSSRLIPPRHIPFASLRYKNIAWKHARPLTVSYLMELVEVIAIRCYSWTCLVLFATGMGLWLFRLSRPASAPAPKSPSLSLSPETTAVISSDECYDNVGRTKGRFTAYFTADEGTVRCRNGKGCECANPDGREPLDWGWRGDLGWYRYQDWTAINGSVVRLWDTNQR